MNLRTWGASSPGSPDSLSSIGSLGSIGRTMNLRSGGAVGVVLSLITI